MESRSPGDRKNSVRIGKRRFIRTLRHAILIRNVGFIEGIVKLPEVLTDYFLDGLLDAVWKEEGEEGKKKKKIEAHWECTVCS